MEDAPSAAEAAIKLMRYRSAEALRHPKPVLKLAPGIAAQDQMLGKFFQGRLGHELSAPARSRVCDE